MSNILVTAGTGKSVLRCFILLLHTKSAPDNIHMGSSTVIEEIVKACPDQSSVAYFYFDFRNERQHMDLM
jgi:hypothetical protein